MFDEKLNIKPKTDTMVGTETSMPVINAKTLEDKIEALIECCRPYGIKELARTGVISMARGTKE